MNKFVRRSIGIVAFIIAMFGFVFLAAVASTAFTLPAEAQTPNAAIKESKCVSIVQAHTDFEAQAKEANAPFAHRILNGNAADRFLKAFNAMPPEGDVQGDKIGIFAAAGMRGVRISIERDGCITAAAMVSPQTYVTLIKASNNERRPV